MLGLTGLPGSAREGAQECREFLIGTQVGQQGSAYMLPHIIYIHTYRNGLYVKTVRIHMGAFERRTSLRGTISYLLLTLRKPLATDNHKSALRESNTN